MLQGCRDIISKMIEGSFDGLGLIIPEDVEIVA